MAAVALSAVALAAVVMSAVALVAIVMAAVAPGEGHGGSDYTCKSLLS